jgi:hypothetical protein
LIRYNTDTALFEGYGNGTWATFSQGSGVTSVGTGTGLLGGPITATGTISIDNTVVATLADAQTLTNKSISGSANTLSNIANSSLTNSAVTIGTDSVSLGSTLSTLNGVSISGSANTLSNIANSSLTNSSVTFNGQTVALGASGTITANTTNALTIGTGLSGTSFNGSAPITIAIDSTVATLTGTQSLTNKTIDASLNTLSNIGNSSLTNSQITLGTTNIALGGTELAPVGLTSVTVTQDPVSNFQLATKQYVDTLVATGIHFHEPVRVESPINLNATYDNGTAGVGATLTNAGTQAALVIDGITVAVNDRVLVYQQTTQTQNGVYVVTDTGSGSTNWVLTRSTDTDTYGIVGPTTLSEGSTFFVQQGATGAGETYTCNTAGIIVFGTTNITFAQISAAQIYSAGTGLTLTGTQFSISNTAVTAASYGSASKTLTATVNAQGQLTALADTDISIAPSQINATIPNSGLTNSAITINGSAISLGGSTSVGTVTSVAGTGTVSGISLSGTVTSSGSLTLGGSLDLSAPPVIGGTTPNTITGTTITATTGIFGGTF